MPRVGFEPTVPVNWAGGHILCLWPRGHCDGPGTSYKVIKVLDLSVNRRFGRTCSFHLVGRRVKSAWSSACCQLHPVSLFGLYFDSEDGSDMFLRNVGSLSKDYMALYRSRTVQEFRIKTWCTPNFIQFMWISHTNYYETCSTVVTN
jgi:hypothetical protein